MDGLTAVVTGAASGIGRALAGALAGRGANLVLADVDIANLRQVCELLGARAVPTDVAAPEAVEALALVAQDARLVCLNAGIVGTCLGAPWEVTPDDWNRVFAVNVGGVVNGLRAFVPRLLASKRRAHILITGSLAGTATFAGGGAYGPSKHAVVAVAEHTAMALADTHVTVSVVCPALVSTGMSSDGVDPSHVAAQALATLDDGTFAVIPDEWRNAVVTRAARLASGQRPRSPMPSSAPAADSRSSSPRC
jgi:NAD(P)-dependent dehydrogenase (short-subunit alcohol dehydrogenase family)